VNYIQKVDAAPKVKTGDYLGELTDELEEFGPQSFIREFVYGAKQLCIFGLFSSHRKMYK
jgi:hypothetical protein